MAWLNPSWTKRKKITIDGTKVAGGVSDFPVYIDLHSDVKSGMQPDGRDLRFTADDGTTLLDHEAVISTAFNDNANWTWFNSPRAVRHGNLTIVGILTANGSVQICGYDHTTGASSVATIAYAWEADDHDNPCILILNSGKIAVFWSFHSGSSFPHSGFRITNSVVTSLSDIDEVADWTITKTWDAAAGWAGGGGTTLLSYANAFHMTDGTVYLIYRNVTGKWGYITAASEADLIAGTFTSDKTLVSTAGRGYCQFAFDKVRSRIHIIQGEHHPDEASSYPTNYTMYYCIDHTSGNIIKADGTTIAALSSVPLNPNTIENVHSVVGLNSWQWSVAFDATTGYPACIYTTFPGAAMTVPAPDHRYNYAKWNGSSWTKSEVCAGGAGLYSGQPFYSGGAAIDPQDISVVYTSSSRDEGADPGTLYKLEQWITADGGATWGSPTLIKAATGKNFRPYVVLGHAGSRTDMFMCLLWASADRGGRYDNFSGAYDTRIETTGPIRALKEVHVKLPSLSSGVSKDIYVYYGNSQATSVSGSGVWSSSYQDVEHFEMGGIQAALQDGKNTVRNRFTQSNNIRACIGPTATTGKLSGSAGVFATGNAVGRGVATPSFAGATEMTVTAWVKASQAQHYIVSSWTTAVVAAGMMLRINATAGIDGFIRLGDGVSTQLGGQFTGITMNASNWVHVVLVYRANDGGNAKLRVYANGVALTPPVGATFASGVQAMHATPSTGWSYGGSPHAGVTIIGSIDETRVASVARSTDWITTEYNNQSDVATFLAFGSEEPYTPDPVPGASSSARRALILKMIR